MGKIALAIVTGGASLIASKLFSHPKPPAAPKPPALPSPPKGPKPGAAEDLAAKQANRRRAAMSQTIYTNPLGVGGQAAVANKTLLGQ